MKKIVSLSTAAVLSAAMACAPMSIVQAQTITDPFEINIADTTIKAGETTVKIPVSFTEDMAFTGATLKFNVEGVKTRFTPEIESIESALPEGAGVTCEKSTKSDAQTMSVVLTSTSGRNYTLKKGDNLLYINVKLPADSSIATKWKLSLKNFDVATENADAYEFSSSQLEASYGYIFAASKNFENMTAKIGEVDAQSKTVEVPMYINGDLYSLNCVLKATNGAVITGITATDPANKEGYMGLGINTAGTSNPEKFMWTTQNKDTDYQFKGTEAMAMITVQLPASAKAGDEFGLSFRYFDGCSVVNDEVYPEEITLGKISYTGVSADKKFTDVAVVNGFVVSDSKQLDLSKVAMTAVVEDADGTKTDISFNADEYFELVKETVEDKFDCTAELKNKLTGETIEVNYLRGLKGDISLDGKVDARDSAYIQSEFAESQFGGTTLKGIYSANDDLKNICDKYTVDKIVEFGKSLGDVDASTKLNAKDAAYILTYFAESMFGGVSWDDILK